MPHRKKPAVVMGAAALTLLLGTCAAQSGVQSGDQSAAQSSVRSGPSGAGVDVPSTDTSPAAHLKGFYQQKLAFKPCDPHLPPGVPAVKAECARLKVPLDYRRPKGEQAEIAVLRVPARAERIASARSC